MIMVTNICKNFGYIFTETSIGELLSRIIYSEEMTLNFSLSGILSTCMNRYK